MPLADIAARTPLQNQATRISNQIWAQAIKAAERDPRLLTSGPFIQTLNDQIDATAARNAELSRHVPEVVIWLILAASLFGDLDYWGIPPAYQANAPASARPSWP